MRNLGKIFLYLISLFSFTYAGVVASVDPSIIYKGDTVTYNLTISGEDIKKPVLDNICGNSIVSTSSRTSIQMINGDYKKSYTLGYSFIPMKSCIVDGIDVEVNGHVEKSNSVKVEVKPVTQTLNGDFVLSLVASKKEVFVGEPFELTLLLKQKRTTDAVDSKFIEPELKGFWTKSESSPVRYNDGQYIVTKMVYKLSAQRDGNLTIKPAQLRIARRVALNSWGSLMPQVRWRSYFSNSVNLKVKVLPNNAKLVGDFHIRTMVDKKEINANEALNVTIMVSGDGNFEDIESFKPYIPGVNVFEEKININNKGLSQKLAFVSDSNFTIPPFELIFYNLKTKRVEKIKTEPMDVVVNGSLRTNLSKPELTIKRSEEDNQRSKSNVVKTIVEVNKLYVFIGFLTGLALGILIMSFSKLNFNSSYKKRLNIKDEKLLLIKLLPYKYDKDVQGIVDILENNIYSSSKQQLDKQILKDIILRYNIV